MRKLPDSCLDLIIADPPFGIEFNGKGTQYNRDADLVVEGYQEIEGNYTNFTYKWISELPRIMKDSGSAFIFSGWTNLSDILNALENSDLVTINHIIWKYQFGVFTKNKFVTSHYHVLFVVKNEKDYYFNKIEHYPLDVWEINRTYSPGEKKNSTKLPSEVVSKCINFCSKPGDLIFDPFMGNGTTAVCAKANFRHYLGFEVNKNLQKIIEFNLNTVKIGENYKPYRTYLPAKDEIIEKYPHLKKYIKEKDENTKKDSKKQTNLLKYT
ncbi:MAG: site-specific DNA-methyltransferase [Promethearchaeota archaeon]|nr:MAG: site-specific DNA-methyltransferase [Candidatus Lokiarchaeota archaeon]